MTRPDTSTEHPARPSIPERPRSPPPRFLIRGAHSRRGAARHTALRHRARRYPRPHRRHLARLASAPRAQLPPLLQRSKHLAHRHLDDAHRHQLARLPAHRIGVAARHRGLHRARSPPSCSRPLPASGWTAGTSARFSSGRKSSPRCNRSRWPLSRSRHRITVARHPRPQRASGADQCLRHARPPGLSGRNGR